MTFDTNSASAPSTCSLAIPSPPLDVFGTAHHDPAARPRQDPASDPLCTHCLFPSIFVASAHYLAPLYYFFSDFHCILVFLLLVPCSSTSYIVPTSPYMFLSNIGSHNFKLHLCSHWISEKQHSLY
ncbi:uncharacterized protein BJ212DRAFT_1379465 [Suillus subaureus]|uniref:Uncharacterized protein n=1 Tax=Suillus subaureus TaxID=48587 RepID=A0A9P7DL96_9AGAM|nr:uncharacterized protein BJ212DRAFT_1405805 [Suillus subaureus]XP_041189160.1 uncharacterized protein BJ212DRAFT_1379465 [Suillus subaureus]KAG1797580.1 hypothetical protein BJ212DRAFT_1405805 [Suillus subaureus]KAG1809334.1 hypothetical protein BJ212DRAFT_1379465 [Suillus subaureus]